VEGFHDPPMVMMGQPPDRTMPETPEEAGRSGRRRISLPTGTVLTSPCPPVMESLLDAAAKRVQVRSLRVEPFLEELRGLLQGYLRRMPGSTNVGVRPLHGTGIPACGADVAPPGARRFCADSEVTASRQR